MSQINDMLDIWEMVKDTFHSTLSESTINLWFGDLKLLSYENDIITFSTESEVKHKIIEEKFLESIKREFVSLLGFPVDVKIVFTGTPVKPKDIAEQFMGESQKLARKEEKKNSSPQPFNFEYTFDNFIVGDSNKFAHAACTAVAQNSSSGYNPLFIYGPSGLGKTHLLSSVVNEIKKRRPDTKVVYIKGDEFTNQLIESLSKQEMHKFREKYRNCDVLLIDDIQFIAGKSSTQEEIFHTFNALHEENKQIIFSSDRPPKDIQPLAERVKTRFEWGLLVDIQPPDLELRVAIIKKKAEQIKVDLSDDILYFLAENLRSNIRQIEGAVRKLSAQSFLMGKPITMEIAKSCLSELLGGAEPVGVTVDKIFTAVFKKYNVPKEELIGNKRTKEIASARHVCIYLIRRITEISLPNIGKIFSRDHATIHSSINQIEKKIHSDPLFNIEIEEMVKDITEE